VIAVDCNGADMGPAEVAAGAVLAAAQGARVLLFGPAEQLGEPGPGIEIVDAPASIAKASDPVSAARATPQASIVQAARAVADGRAQALVCAGGTGAALAAGTFNIRRARGIYRPALAIPLPVPHHPVTLLDVGANADARREHLVQFAFMGAALATTVLDVPRPRVGLLSNGEEPERGSALILETHAALAEQAAAGDLEAFEFVGNVEGGDLMSGVADVVVSDGLTGNIALKLMEGVSQTMLRARGDAAAPIAAFAARRARPGGQRRRLSAGPATPRRGAARALHARRFRTGDPACAARRTRRHRRADPRRAGACGRAQTGSGVRSGR
jgi:glycerol-3-phosphate acyltransferase PlsX